MTTIFEKIIGGQIPGNFIWADEHCVAIATIEPVSAGHSLVIPRLPIDRWTDLSPDLLAHLFKVSQIIGQAQQCAFDVCRSVVVIAGFEVPHAHIHVIPARTEADHILSNAKPATPQELTGSTILLRNAIRLAGHSTQVPPDLKSANIS